MPKYKPPRPQTKTRTENPIPFPTKDGIELRCPFCADHHKLLPNIESACGTRIEVTAVQEIYPVHTVKHKSLTCVKCFQGGGEMVRFNNSFVHLIDCKPGSRLLQDIPPNSRMAEIVYKLPVWLKTRIEKLTGKSDRVLEIDEKGEKTGKVIAYIFWSNSGKQIPT